MTLQLPRRRLLAGGATIVALPALAQTQPSPENTLHLELKDGRVVIEMLPEFAPRHVERIRVLTRRRFYDNTPFHRVIPGFMAQGGDPTGTGTGGSDLPDLPAEFVQPSRARFIRGTCGMARAQNPNSANSQFFIMFAPASSLDGQYTIWGRVVSGMEAVDQIKAGTQQNNGIVRDPDRIRSMRLAG